MPRTLTLTALADHLDSRAALRRQARVACGLGPVHHARVTHRYVLGMNKYDHDVSAVLLRDGVPIVGIPKERITRVKNAGGIPDAAVSYCLRAARIGLSDVDLIVQNSYALQIPEMERDLLSRVHALHLPAYERRIALESPLFRHPDAVTISHHLAHAYSAFAVAPFDSGAVMVVDGVGSHRRYVNETIPAGDGGHAADRESESYYVFDGLELTTVKKVFLPVEAGVLSEEFTRLAGLGALYSRVSEYVFNDWNKCGEVMGLAAFGKDNPDIPALMGVKDGGTWALALWPESFRHPYDALGDGRGDWEASEHQQHWRDICWRVQNDLEEALLTRARELHAATGAKNLVIAGGVALNCVANARLAAETPFENVYVQPAAGDSGIAIGCAYYGEIALAQQPRQFVMRTDFLGRSYSDEEIDATLKEKPWKRFMKVVVSDDIATDTARALAAGEVVGWFQGGAEFGPRALGHRSIVSDPRSEHAKIRLNATVKHRQAFRPFAPAVLHEKTDDWFEAGEESTCMLFVRTIRPEKRDAVPAVAHVDGTARVQTVRAADNPEFHGLIAAFDKLTGVPIVVNTSFNVRGQPIVETPRDAFYTFLTTDMDVLVLGNRMVRKRSLFKHMRRILLEISGLKQFDSVSDMLKEAASRYADS